MTAILIYTRQKTMKFSLAEICYIHTHPSKPHRLQLFTEDQAYDYPGKLSELENLYPMGLVRCHRSSLVNPAKIKEINQKEKVLVLGERRQYTIPYSRRCYQKVWAMWLEKGETEYEYLYPRR